MGTTTPAGSERADTLGTDVRLEHVRSQNTGVCMESSDPGVKLHLGSGKLYWHGWTNIDLYSQRADARWDLTKLELPDNYADVAVAIHVIEHFYEWDAPAVLAEWQRVLRPGGRLIL